MMLSSEINKDVNNAPQMFEKMDHYSDDPYIPFLSITPIGKGSPLETVIRPRGPKGNAGF